MTEPVTQTKPKRVHKTYRSMPYAFSQFEIEQHAMANKAMNTIYAPC